MWVLGMAANAAAAAANFYFSRWSTQQTQSQRTTCHRRLLLLVWASEWLGKELLWTKFNSPWPVYVGFLFVYWQWVHTESLRYQSDFGWKERGGKNCSSQEINNSLRDTAALFSPLNPVAAGSLALKK
jgi:hypothetical protein